jgi:thiamine pyrophosphokinase
MVLALTIQKTYATPVILVGGGDIAWQQLEVINSSAYSVIGVDGGAVSLYEKGIIAELIIGDLDSVSNISSFPASTEIIKLEEQQTTDFEKALYSIDAPLFICFGFWGNRLDHCMSALHVLMKYRGQKCVVMVDQADFLFTPHGPIDIELSLKTRFSIYPLEATTFTASSGLLYPLDGLTLKAGDAIGTSNQTNSSRIRISPTNDTQVNYVVILPNSELRAVLSSIF